MIPVAPSISVRPLAAPDYPAVAALVSALITSAPYSRSLDAAKFAAEVCADEPPAVYPVSWQRQQLLGAWRAGQLAGFLHLAIGRDGDSLDLPEYHPLGLVRFLALPPRAELINEVAQALFAHAQEYWRANGIGYIKAFHISTGYPSFQGGAGILPGDWSEHVRVLTMLGFTFQTRYYCLSRALHEPVEEAVPLADLSLAFRGTPADRTYQLYYRRTEFVASARYILVPAGAGDATVSNATVSDATASDDTVGDAASAARPFAHLIHIEVNSRWRRRNIARWLLRRMINDATLQGYPEMVVHVAHPYAALLNLLAQHGFQELNYRGYSLELSLTD